MNRIRAARVRQRLTQQELSIRSGLSQAYINELENGKKTNPTIIVLDKLAAGLQVPISELLEPEGVSISGIARDIDLW